MFIQSAYLLQFIHSTESKWKQSKIQIVEENKREKKNTYFVNVHKNYVGCREKTQNTFQISLDNALWEMRMMCLLQQGWYYIKHELRYKVHKDAHTTKK